VRKARAQVTSAQLDVGAGAALAKRHLERVEDEVGAQTLCVERFTPRL
jgi:hypothetical protein